MAITFTPSLALQGAIGAFYDSLNAAPQVWKNNVMMVASTSAKETYAFPGAMPIPRVLQNARSIQGFRDMKFDVVNNTYELTLMIKLEDFEDDQVQGLTRRFGELGEVFGTYKDEVFATLLTDNNAPPMADDDAVTWANFYTSSGTVGASSSLDNTIAYAITGSGLGTTVPTGDEFIVGLTGGEAQMNGSDTGELGVDDQGRAGFNALATTKLRVVIPPIFKGGAMEAMNATTIATDAGTASRSNVFAGMAGIDVLPYLSSNAIMYVNAVGATRKPFIYQQRTALEIKIDDDQTRIHMNNGVLVTVRERWVMTYGDPRRSVQVTFS